MHHRFLCGGGCRLGPEADMQGAPVYFRFRGEADMGPKPNDVCK
jgi:hypothetical protein